MVFATKYRRIQEVGWGGFCHKVQEGQEGCEAGAKPQTPYSCISCFLWLKKSHLLYLLSFVAKKSHLLYLLSFVAKNRHEQKQLSNLGLTQRHIEILEI